MARRSKAPRPGSYTGRVAGYPATFVIDEEMVEAVWYVPRKSAMRGFIQHSDAWDVSNGGFTPDLPWQACRSAYRAVEFLCARVGSRLRFVAHGTRSVC